MRRNFVRELSIAFVTIGIPSAAFSQTGDVLRNWPQWRGPLACGAAPQGDPPIEWSESKNIRWKIEISGRGNSTPAIWGDRIYLTTAIPAEAGEPGVPADAPAEKKPGGPRLGEDDGRVALELRDVERANVEFGGAHWQYCAAGLDSIGSQESRPAQEQPSQERPERGGRRGRGGGQEGPGGGDRPEGGGRGGRPDGPGRGGRGPGRAVTAQRFVVLALDRQSGKTVWEKVVREEKPHEAGHPDSSYASPSPITDGTHVWAFFGSRGLYCLDARDGSVVWQKDFGKMQTRSEFGEGSSPALHSDTIVVNWDHEGEDCITALAAKTGQERWKTKRDEPTTWSTPLMIEVGGKTQVVTSGTQRVRAYDLATGAMVWDCEGLTPNVIPSPVASDRLVFAISGFRGAALKAIDPAGASGDISGTKSIVWTWEKNTPYIPSPLLYEGSLYFLDNNRGVISCLDAKTGKVNFGPQRLDGAQNVYASPVGAAGRVYVVGKDGATAVLKAGPTFEQIGVNSLDEGFEASPAVVGKEMYLRGAHHLYCIAAK